MCRHMSPRLNPDLSARRFLNGKHQPVAWASIPGKILAEPCGTHADLAREVGLLAALKICGERLHAPIFSQ